MRILHTLPEIFLWVLANVSDLGSTGSGFSWVCESGSGSMQAKMADTQERKVETFQMLDVLF
jgi:hypothetical protein